MRCSLTLQTVGIISGALVGIGVIPYAYRVWQGKTAPVLTSWILWTLIGFSLLLTYKSSGAEANVWPAVTGFTNPLIISILIWYRKGERRGLDQTERVCVRLCLLALIGWWFLKENRQLVQYALYLSIFADMCAAWPTIKALWKDPESDRPFCWASFGLAYSLVFFAIPELTVANLALPVWMVTGSTIITVPMVWYRIKKRIPLKEWI